MNFLLLNMEELLSLIKLQNPYQEYPLNKQEMILFKIAQYLEVLAYDSKLTATD